MNAMPKLAAVFFAIAALASAQSNPLWHEQKVKNYLPHMTWPEVQDLLTRTDMVIFPIASIEQHGPPMPVGTDYLAAVEQAKLIAQKTDVLVAPILLPGLSPYHMEFPGTITLSSDTIQRVFFEAAQSLIHHGFRRFLILNGHTGDQFITRYIADRLNQETEAIAVDLNDAVALLSPGGGGRGRASAFDRHAGVGETSSGLYLFPSLVEPNNATANHVTLPGYLEEMLPQVKSGDPVANFVFLAEALKPLATGKHTSTREMTATGAWSERDTHDATEAQGRAASNRLVDGSVQFIDRWKQLRPMDPLSARQKYDPPIYAPR
jgi:creatinine amidohydrolase